MRAKRTDHVAHAVTPATPLPSLLRLHRPSTLGRAPALANGACHEPEPVRLPHSVRCLGRQSHRTNNIDHWLGPFLLQ
eukprot:15441690-Alexandrium_andersonii.AAC.1